MSDKKVEMFTRNGCPYCEMARDWFISNNIEFTDHILNDYDERLAMYETLNDDPLVKDIVSTVPQIFVCGKYIGGYTDLLDSIDEVIERLGA